MLLCFVGPIESPCEIAEVFSGGGCIERLWVLLDDPLKEQAGAVDMTGASEREALDAQVLGPVPRSTPVKASFELSPDRFIPSRIPEPIVHHAQILSAEAWTSLLFIARSGSFSLRRSATRVRVRSAVDEVWLNSPVVGPLRIPPMPWRLLGVCTLVGVAGGAIFGFVRGLRYVPTLPFAIIEGGILVGVPATVLGLVLVAAWSLSTRVRRSAHG
jgi:hypothetical protein